MFLQQPVGPGISENEVLDEFTIPFGTWTEQAVNWTKNNLQGLLDAIAWPFEFLLDNVVDNFLLEIPWWVLVLMMTAIAWLARNLTVALGTAAGLVVCGLLGQEYWVQTARTIGFIVVAVVICVIVGIPVGILAGRIDSVWSVLRPTLDAMQVIHSFVYLLPFIYFWGIGEVGATMATMIFALPPLIRLTNLGIRQVPEDVVEAARAYGAPEFKVLLDVQLPLARPAIMTGINQTLLLAFSMLGVAAIMGAGGLGSLLFRALGQQDVSLAASSGLAFFILAVMLDRIAQPPSGAQTNLFGRMVGAWRARRAPEVLLDDPSFNPDAAPLEEEHDRSSEGSTELVGAGERQSIYGVLVGTAVVVISMFLTWGSDAALISGYSRRSDQELPGQSFSGLAAEGGSWFGYTTLALALIAALAAVMMLTRPGAGGRYLSPDGALLASIATLVTVFAYFITSPSDLTIGYGHGIGVYVALLGGLIATAASARWVATAPYGPRRPLKPHVVTTPIVLGGFAVILAVVSLFSSWILDERQDVVITPAIQAEIDEVIRAAEAGEMEPGVAATEIQTIRAQAVAEDAIVIDGKSSAGPGLGIWSLLLAVGAGAAALVAAGVAGLGDRKQWIGGTVAMGLGLGVVGLGVGWAGSLARATDPNHSSGVGVMIAGIAGLILFVAGRSIVAGFERSKVYSELPELDGGADDSRNSGAPRTAAAADALSSTVAT